MAVRPLQPFNLTNCPQCQSQLNVIINALGITMDSQGNLKNPNLNYYGYISRFCIVCQQNGHYNFDLTLQCLGTFFVDRQQNDWVMGNWKCPSPTTGKTADMKTDENVLTSDNINLIPPVHPGVPLKAWFMNRPEEEQQKFLRDTEIPDITLTRIFNAEAPIDKPIAQQLARVFGDEAEFWYWMQLNFDEYQTTGHEINKDSLPRLFP